MMRFKNVMILNAATELDGLTDFDLVLRDPSNPNNMLPSYAGDAIHPNAAGHIAMVMPLRWLCWELDSHEL